MKRREFMKSGISCAALASIPGVLSTANQSATGKARIPLGFFGITYSHGPGKLKVLLASPDFEVAGVCESDPAARQSAEKAGAKILSQDALLERSRVIAVESAVRDHAPHALIALKAGKHVHVEKPPSMNFKDMQQMVALARERKLLLQTGYMWRYNPAFIAVFEAVRKGWLGEVFLVRAFMNNNLAAARRPEWAEYKGGSMFELASHLVDCTVRLLGRPKAVIPVLRRHGNFNDTLKDNNAAVLEFDRALAVVTNSSLQASGTPGRAFEVLGTKGSALVQPIEPPELKIDLVEAAGPYKKGPQTVPMPGYERYEADFVELAAAIRAERQLSVSLDEELLVHETILKASEML